MLAGDSEGDNKMHKKAQLKHNTPATLGRVLPALYSQEDQPASAAKVRIKFFNPSGVGTWYVTEYDPEEDVAFGFCVLGGPGELGYVSLAELRAIKCSPFGMGIERDVHWDPKTTLADVQAGRVT